MIYRLRNKFVRITILSFLAVLTALFLVLYVVTSLDTRSSLDMFADLISYNGGFFPKFDESPAGQGRINPETPYTTRFFTASFDQNGNFDLIDISFISITDDEAIAYAHKALSKGTERGWIGDYRYKIYATDNGQSIVFVFGTDRKNMNRNFLLSTAGVFAAGSLVVLILVIIFSKRAVKPIAENYEKQKQFITDANHELKTPLTLIRTDIELAQSELGENEWLQDIRSASEQMNALVEQLVSLTRMDEDSTRLQYAPCDLSGIVSDTAYVFEPLMTKRNFAYNINVAQGVSYVGDEAMLRQLVSILLDNAAKYCDSDGRIDVTLNPGRHPILTVDNTFRNVDDIELKRLFDRFYRSNRARTPGSGSGIGLSIAQMIVEKHHGLIEAQKKETGVIRFYVRF